MKQKRIAVIIFYVMRITFIQIALALIFSFSSYANNVEAQAVLNKPVTVVAEQKTVKKILVQIQKQTGVKFTYSSDVIDINRKISCSITNKKLIDFLTEVLKPLDIDYQVIDDEQILLFPIQSKTENTLKNFSVVIPIDVIISGVVTNEKGELLQGATITEKGTKNITATDATGNFKLKVKDERTVIVVSYTGYKTKEVVVDGEGKITIVLTAVNNVLNEVVVIGYGSVKRKDLTGSVSVANQKDFGDVSVSNSAQLIQGKLAGVQVVNRNGLPGSGSNIIIRGAGSFTNAEPLYVIDGLQSNSSAFNSISPSDIESITVLKDASSVAIYGAQGANGVVIVNTKKGRAGELKITYNAYIGISQTWKKLSLLNASEYVALVKEIASSQNTNLPAKLNTPYVLQDRTNWQNEIFRTGTITDHYVSASGGTNKVNYFLSAGYTNQQAILIGYDFKRFNLRMNLEEKLGRFKFGQNMILVGTQSSGNVPNLNDAIRHAPYAPVYDSTNLGGYSKTTSIDDLNDDVNPLPFVRLVDNNNRSMKTLLQIYGVVALIKGLTLRSQVALEFNNSGSHYYQSAFANGNLIFQSGAGESFGYNSLPLTENFLTYNKSFGIHTITVLAGNTYRAQGAYRNLSAGGSGFSSDALRNIGVATSQSVTGFGTGAAQSVLISYFGRINYSLFDRYILTASIRRDGSSVFGPNNRFGNFPSAGIAWKLSEEPFMKGITALSNIKLRASWGRTGNANIPSFMDQPQVWKGSTNNIVYSFGPNKAYVNGATIAALSNQNLKWETTTQTDVGLEFSTLKNKLLVTLDYYNRNNNDLLVYVPIEPSAGIGGIGGIGASFLSNAASAYNKGFEGSVSYNQVIGKFNFSVTANAAYNKNQVTSLGNKGAFPITSGFANGGINVTRTDIGHGIGDFYGYVIDHVAINQADIDKYNAIAQNKTNNPNAVYQNGLLPGDIIFKDLNGDGIVDSKDQAYLGSPIPKWTYGLNLNASYTGFDLMVALQGVSDVSLFNDQRYWTEGTTRPYNGITTLLGRWRNPGDISTIPKAGQNANTNLNLRPSNRFIENGAYLRVRNITLGYHLSSDLLRSLTKNSVSSIRLYITAQNLFTITKYSGYDPEVSSANNDLLFNRGIDGGQYPQARSFLFGLQVAF